MGTLKPGDVILAINGQSMQNCNLREAAHALRNAGDVVTLTISKECCERPTTGCKNTRAHHVASLSTKGDVFMGLYELFCSQPVLKNA